MSANELPRLDEELVKQQLDEEVRKEYSKQDRDERFEEYVTARRAISIWRASLTTVAMVLGVPITGLCLGLAVRLFRWAAGV